MKRLPTRTRVLQGLMKCNPWPLRNGTLPRYSYEYRRHLRENEIITSTGTYKQGLIERKRTNNRKRKTRFLPVLVLVQACYRYGQEGGTVLVKTEHYEYEYEYEYRGRKWKGRGADGPRMIGVFFDRMTGRPFIRRTRTAVLQSVVSGRGSTPGFAVFIINKLRFI